jgi:hypothetical protein
VAVITAEVIQHVYEFTSAKQEFLIRSADSKSRYFSLENTFKSVNEIGYSEIDLYHFQKWFQDLRLFKILESEEPDSKKMIWRFKLVMLHPPRADKLQEPRRQHLQSRIDPFVVLLKKFYAKAFSATKEATQSIALAVENEISFMVVVLKCPSDQEHKSFWNEDKKALKIVGAITFRVSTEHPDLDHHHTIYVP